MSISRYFRLMLLSCLEIALTLPLGAFSIYINTSGVPISPYKSWADTHYQFWVVLQIPAFIWRGDQANAIAVEMGRWIYPCAAFLFFALFGFAEEARRHYRAAFWWVFGPFGFNNCSKVSPFRSASRYALPTHLDFRYSRINNYISSSCSSSLKSPATPRTVDFLPVYSRAGSDTILRSSRSFGKSYDIVDIEKLAAASPSDDSYMFYLQSRLPEDGAQDLDCIVITRAMEQHTAELELPLTPSTPSSASTIFEADIGTAH